MNKKDWNQIQSFFDLFSVLLNYNTVIASRAEIVVESVISFGNSASSTEIVTVY